MDVFGKISPYENLNIEHFKITEKDVNLNGIAIKTRLEKVEFDKSITTERDHFNIKFQTLNVKDYILSFDTHGVLKIESPKIEAIKMRAIIYRNKLVNDDTSIKAMYSKILRNSSFNFRIKQLELVDSNLVYQEKTKLEEKAGQLNFNQLNMSILNLNSGFDTNAKVKIDINTIFMKQTLVELFWNFNVNSKTDEFLFKAKFGALPAKDLNPFVTPNLLIKLEGVLDETYFTINGNNVKSSVDFRTKYKKFKIDLLDSETHKVKRFLTGLLNLFIAKKSKDENGAYRNVLVKNIERDQTKSVFNFIWLNARSGLLKAMTGKDEK